MRKKHPFKTTVRELNTTIYTATTVFIISSTPSALPHAMSSSLRSLSPFPSSSLNVFILILSLLSHCSLAMNYQTQVIAGTNDIGSTNGPGLSATFNHPFGCVISPNNSYGLIADTRNGLIRKLHFSVTQQQQAAAPVTVSTLRTLPNVYSLCFSDPNTLWVTNIATLQRIDLKTMTSTIIASTIDLSALACSHDGQTILITTYRGIPSASPRNLYILSSATTQKVNLTLLATLPADSLGVTFSSDDTFALVTTLSNSLFKVIVSTGVVTQLSLPRALVTPIGISLMNDEYLIVEPASGITRYNLESNTLSPTIPIRDSFGICSSSDSSFGLVTLYQQHKIALLTDALSTPTAAPTFQVTSKDYKFSLLAGSGSAGSHDDFGLAASFNLPWGCAISNDKSFGLIADNGNSLVRKYNFETGEVTTPLANLAVGFIVTSPSRNNVAYFTSTDGIYQFDLSTNVATRIVSVSSLAPLAVSPNGEFLLATSYKGSNIDTSDRVIYRLNVTSNVFNLENFFTFPFDSLGLVISDDNSFAYISSLYQGLIYRLDLTTKLMTSLSLPRTLAGPTGIALVDKSFLLITEYLGSGVSRLNLVTREITTIIPVSQANGICMSSDSSLGLVSLLRTHQIGGLVSTSLPVFSASPTMKPTISPTVQTKTSPPTPEIVNRPAHDYIFSIIAGSGTAGSHDDVGLAATFGQPWGCAISSDNSFGLIAETGNRQLRKLMIGSAIVQTTSQTNLQIGFVCIASQETAYFTSNQGIHFLDLTSMTSTLIAPASMLGAIACSPNNRFLLVTTHKGITSDFSTRPIYQLSLTDGSHQLETAFNFPFDSLGITIAADNRIVYVTALSEGSIYRLDLTTKSMTSLALPRTLAGPTGISLIEFGSYLLITEYLGSGISRLNLVTGELTILTTVSQPNGICMSSDSSLGLVSLRNTNEIGFLQRQSNGNDLLPGQCCIPGKVDHYCSYNGVCDESGTFCICTDPSHYSSSDRCMNYYSNLPDTCPPLQFPYIPTQKPTPAPTYEPTRRPNPVVCNQGDRTYCFNRGVCNSRGDGCTCDDQIHFWTSDRCQTRHDGPELEAGQFCFPNSVDSYCSFMGICNNEGTDCECFDSAHRLSSERCATWHPITTGVCRPYDRTYCSNRGTCSPTGEGCICDNEQHYWASERCSKSHPGPELAEDQCCSPDEVNAYCNYLGVCNSEGTKCECFDPNHRLSSERCLIYYETFTPEQIAANNSTNPSGTTCPGFLSETDEPKNSKSNQDGETTSIILIAVGVAVGIAFTTMMIVFLAQRQTIVSTNSALKPKGRMSWYEDNPIQQVVAPRSLRRSSSESSGSQIRRQSSLNPFKKSESYVEISEVTMPSEMMMEDQEDQHLGSDIY